MDETDLFSKKKKQKETTDSHAIKAADDPNVNDFIEKGPIRSIRTADYLYNSNHPNVGIALIFNHKEVRGQTPRKGTEKDRDRIKDALKKYGFDVRVFNDLTFEKLNEIIKAVANEDHTNNDCLVVVVMSHGIEGKVFAKDMTYPVERLWTPFLGNNCKSLINKPKLFFIQACRGTKLDQPVQFVVSPMSRFGNEQPATMTYAIPTTADLLVFYSTFEGHYSFRNVENGSWFIQGLCLILEQAATDSGAEGTELYQLLTAVNREVAYAYQSMTESEKTNEMKEMPNFLSTLTKIFYLKVKRN